MTERPNFIDNIEGNTLSKALKNLLDGDETQLNFLSFKKIDQARIATAYFSPVGFSSIAKSISPIPSIKLLLGSDPIADNAMAKKVRREQKYFQEN